MEKCREYFHPTIGPFLKNRELSSSKSFTLQSANDRPIATNPKETSFYEKNHDTTIARRTP
jgi:hypothetical protein